MLINDILHDTPQDKGFLIAFVYYAIISVSDNQMLYQTNIKAKSLIIFNCKILREEMDLYSNVL